MTVKDAIEKIHAPKGFTSVIAGVMSGDFDPIRDQKAVGESLETAKEKLAAAEKAQENCTSDWAYWGYMGDISYWRAVVDILTADEIGIGGQVADVEAPDLEGCVVMDACSKVENFGREVLKRTREIMEATHEPTKPPRDDHRQPWDSIPMAG